MRDVGERLRDVLEAIARIERYSATGRDAFMQDELIQTWVVHHLQIIGEAVAGLPEGIRDRSPTTPWRQIVGMRNILVHHYFDIDRDVVWKVVERDLPILRQDITALFADIR